MSAKTVAQRLSDDPETQAKLERSLTRLFDDEAELVLAKVEEFEEKAGAMPEGDVLLRLVNVIVDELLRARENGSWPDPESLCVDLSPPPFPAIYLPGPIATYVRALAEDLQVPLDLAGALTSRSSLRRFSVGSVSRLPRTGTKGSPSTSHASGEAAAGRLPRSPP